jgi:hypothetical protein
MLAPPALTQFTEQTQAVSASHAVTWEQQLVLEHCTQAESPVAGAQAVEPELEDVDVDDEVVDDVDVDPQAWAQLLATHALSVWVIVSGC